MYMCIYVGHYFCLWSHDASHYHDDCMMLDRVLFVDYMNVPCCSWTLIFSITPTHVVLAVVVVCDHLNLFHCNCYLPCCLDFACWWWIMKLNMCPAIVYDKSMKMHDTYWLLPHKSCYCYAWIMNMPRIFPWFMFCFVIGWCYMMKLMLCCCVLVEFCVDVWMKMPWPCC